MANRAPIVLGVLALAGCARGEELQTFELRPAEAFDRLRAADIIGFRNASKCGMLIHVTAHEQGREAIRFNATTGNYRVAQFTVRLIPDGAGTAARIEVSRDPDGGEAYDGSREYSHPALTQPIRPLIRELVDAALNKRVYDVHRIPDPEVPDVLCGSLATNAAAGYTYSIDDPAFMPHAQAEEARREGEVLHIEHDPGHEFIGNSPWQR